MTAEHVSILLVEDSPSDAALLRESLAEAGFGSFQFTHAQCWAEAVEHLRESRFDVMLLDLSLPDVTGRQTFVQARSAAPNLPIVVLTGVEDELVGLEAVRHGIQDYLIKGQAFGRQTARAVRYAIERKQTEAALKTAEENVQRERDQLETRVKERTAQLSRANRTLRVQIVQRQRAEQAHRQVLRRLSEAEETERGRISRELHDCLGQNLTALKLGIQSVRRQGPFADEVRHTLDKLEKLSDSLMQDLHRLAWELRPSVLDDLGLELALRRYCKEWSRNVGIPIDFISRGWRGFRFSLELETTLYRVAQEALTNVAKHAQARRVSVLLERRTECLSLIVEDDGKGFDSERSLQSSAKSKNLGLLGMRERVSLVGGRLDIESSGTSGTSIFIRLPMSKPVRKGRKLMA